MSDSPVISAQVRRAALEPTNNNDNKSINLVASRCRRRRENWEDWKSYSRVNDAPGNREEP